MENHILKLILTLLNGGFTMIYLDKNWKSNLIKAHKDVGSSQKYLALQITALKRSLPARIRELERLIVSGQAEISAIVRVLLVCLPSLLFFPSTSQGALKQPPFTPQEAILAIIGEAEGESMTGKIAVAEVIRKRNSLKGVYGARAPRVINHRYSQSAFQEAQKAWELSENTSYSQGADGWGSSQDVQIFKHSSWFKNCYIITKIGAHYFWKKKIN